MEAAEELGVVVAGEVTPGEDFIGRTGTLGVEGGVEIVGGEGVEVALVVEVFGPRVEAGAVLVGGFEDIAAGHGKNALTNQFLDAMFDFARLTTIVDGFGESTRQIHLLIGSFHQHCPAVGTSVRFIEGDFDGFGKEILPIAATLHCAVPWVNPPNG